MVDLERGEGILGTCGIVLMNFLGTLPDEEIDDLLAFLDGKPEWEKVANLAKLQKQSPYYPRPEGKK